MITLELTEEERQLIKHLLTYATMGETGMTAVQKKGVRALLKSVSSATNKDLPEWNKHK